MWGEVLGSYFSKKNLRVCENNETNWDSKSTLRLTMPWSITAPVDPSWQHRISQSNHPSMYWLGSTLLKFNDRRGTGVSTWSDRNTFGRKRWSWKRNGKKGKSSKVWNREKYSCNHNRHAYFYNISTSTVNQQFQFVLIFHSFSVRLFIPTSRLSKFLFW